MLTTTYVPGAPNWLDLGSPDTAASIAFYGSVFGWEFQSAGPDAGGYGFFQLDGKTVAALGPLVEEGASPAWTVYFHTSDADATAKAVEQTAGAVRLAPDDVFTAGRMGGFTDPTGAQFAVWQPYENPGLEVVTVPNSLARVELYTTDTAAAKAFYSSVFSWRSEEVEMGEGVSYTVVSPAAGSGDSAHGGILQLTEEHLAAGSTSEWHPYFEVTDCDAAVAAATEHGGTVIIPAMDAPGIGRMAMFLDPFGAPFAVMTSAAA
jgi:predicted enzyme related to lactoylglutathione lyase